jgi:hypothetical protein
MRTIHINIIERESTIKEIDFYDALCAMCMLNDLLMTQTKNEREKRENISSS